MEGRGTKGVSMLLEVTYEFIAHTLCRPLTGLILRNSHVMRKVMAEVARGWRCGGGEKWETKEGSSGQRMEEKVDSWRPHPSRPSKEKNPRQKHSLLGANNRTIETRAIQSSIFTIRRDRGSGPDNRVGSKGERRSCCQVDAVSVQGLPQAPCRQRPRGGASHQETRATAFR